MKTISKKIISLCLLAAITATAAGCSSTGADVVLDVSGVSETTELEESKQSNDESSTVESSKEKGNESSAVESSAESEDESSSVESSGENSEGSKEESNKTSQASHSSESSKSSQSSESSENSETPQSSQSSKSESSKSTSSSTVAVTGISLSKSSVSLTVGSTTTISAAITPSNATDKSFSWTTSNNNVASISADGTITAKSAGTATITVKTSNGKTASCTVTVTAKQASTTQQSSQSSQSSKSESSAVIDEKYAAYYTPYDVDAIIAEMRAYGESQGMIWDEYFWVEDVSDENGNRISTTWGNTKTDGTIYEDYMSPCFFFPKATYKASDGENLYGWIWYSFEELEDFFDSDLENIRFKVVAVYRGYNDYYEQEVYAFYLLYNGMNEPDLVNEIYNSV